LQTSHICFNTPVSCHVQRPACLSKAEVEADGEDR
jgi:hypothetical protein